jgi:hypothetical protein
MSRTGRSPRPLHLGWRLLADWPRLGLESGPRLVRAETFFSAVNLADKQTCAEDRASTIAG